MLDDMTVGHPVAWIARLEEDIDGLSSSDEDGIFPDKICLSDSISTQYEKTIPMKMDRMLHRVHGVFSILDMDLREVTDLESPVIDSHPSFPRLGILQDPLEVLLSTFCIHHTHRIFPLDPIMSPCFSHHPHFSTHFHPTHSWHFHLDDEIFIWSF